MKYLVLSSITLLIFGGILIYRKYPPPKPPLKLTKLREFKIKESFYPSLIFANNRFYVSHEFQGSISVNEYDEDFNLLKTSQLTNNEGMDHRLVFGHGYFYLANSFYLRKFDLNFKELKKNPILKDIPAHAKLDVAERGDLDDMLLQFADATLYLGKGYSLEATVKDKSGKKPNKPDNLYLVEYNENLEFVRGTDLKENGFMAMSLIVKNDGIYVINADKKWEDTSLLAVRYDRRWQLLDKKVISAEPQANEEFASGTLYHDGYYYVSYMKITGVIEQPEPGNDFMNVAVYLKVFDATWNLLDQVDVSEIPKDIDTGHNGRSSLALVGNKVYVAYDGVENSGPPRVIIKEYLVK